MSKSINNQSIADLSSEVNEVTNLLKTNVDKIVDRGERIDNLHERSANLGNNAIRFQKCAVEVRRKARWKNIKLNIFIIIAVCMFIGILAGILVGIFHKDSPAHVRPTPGVTSSPTPLPMLLQKLHS